MCSTPPKKVHFKLARRATLNTANSTKEPNTICTNICYHSPAAVREICPYPSNRLSEPFSGIPEGVPGRGGLWFLPCADPLFPAKVATLVPFAFWVNPLVAFQGNSGGCSEDPVFRARVGIRGLEQLWNHWKRANFAGLTPGCKMFSASHPSKFRGSPRASLPR